MSEVLRHHVAPAGARSIWVFTIHAMAGSDTYCSPHDRCPDRRHSGVRHLLVPGHVAAHVVPWQPRHGYELLGRAAARDAGLRAHGGRRVAAHVVLTRALPTRLSQSVLFFAFDPFGPVPKDNSGSRAADSVR